MTQSVTRELPLQFALSMVCLYMNGGIKGRWWKKAQPKTHKYSEPAMIQAWGPVPLLRFLFQQHHTCFLPRASIKSARELRNRLFLFFFFSPPPLVCRHSPSLLVMWPSSSLCWPALLKLQLSMLSQFKFHFFFFFVILLKGGHQWMQAAILFCWQRNIQQMYDKAKGMWCPTPASRTKSVRYP